MSAPSGNTTALFCGSDKARQEIGDPGHCEPCAELGHVLAHPDLGCRDVGCNSAHAPDPAATAEQTVADLLALCAVYEAKPIAHQWIRPSVIRSIIESGGAE